MHVLPLSLCFDEANCRLCNCARRAPEALLSDVLSAMASFCGTTEPSDDVAALILRFDP